MYVIEGGREGRKEGRKKEGKKGGREGDANVGRLQRKRR